jgi:hypothetical protein
MLNPFSKPEDNTEWNWALTLHSDDLHAFTEAFIFEINPLSKHEIHPTLKKKNENVEVKT